MGPHYCSGVFPEEPRCSLVLKCTYIVWLVSGTVCIVSPALCGNRCFSLSLIDDTNGDGGPSQQELLEMIQNCDISSSLVSSVVSSRAPSPSPSLMNIMFSGMRAGGPSTPSGTPSTIARTGRAALFQPIVRSTSGTALSGSSLSLTAQSTAQQSPSLPSARTAMVEWRQSPAPAVVDKVQQQSAQPALRDACSQTDQECVMVKTDDHIVALPDREEQETGSSGDLQLLNSNDAEEISRSGRNHEQVELTMDSTIPAVYHSATIDGESTVVASSEEPLHQRSHSNVIDYGKRKSSTLVANFRSPPGTMRGFRPVRSNSPMYRNSPLNATTASTAQSSTGAASGIVSQPFGSPREFGGRQDLVPLVLENNSRPASHGISPPPWLKEFDSTLFEYFSSGDDSEYAVINDS